MEELYLVHHGILGQKWGVRRYQNPDGTLTEAGKKRLNKINNKVDKINTRKEKYYNKYLETKDKNFTFISPEAYLIETMSLEEQYDSLKRQAKKYLGKQQIKKMSVPVTMEDYLHIAKKMRLNKNKIEQWEKEISDINKKKNISKEINSEIGKRRRQEMLNQMMIQEQQRILQQVIQNQIHQQVLQMHHGF